MTIETIIFEKWEEKEAAGVEWEIAERPQKRTKAGLFRAEPPFGKYITRLTEVLEANIGMPAHDLWGMRHKPGGKEVFMHSHNNWRTVTFYPRPYEAGLILEDEVYQPVGGDYVILPVGTMHGVEANKSHHPRYSVVWLFGAANEEA